MNTPEMGRVNRMRGDPCDMSIDCPSDISIICAMTHASTMGAIGNPNFRMKYPITPKRVMTQTSYAMNRMLYVPSTEKKTISGPRM